MLKLKIASALSLIILFFTACTAAGSSNSARDRIQEILNEDLNFFKNEAALDPTQAPEIDPNSESANSNTKNSSTLTGGTSNTQCVQDQEVSRSCTACSTATVIRLNADCSTYSRTETDNSCTNGCTTGDNDDRPKNTTPPVNVTCLKICPAGKKACGDNCIGENASCNKPPGTACNP